MIILDFSGGNICKNYIITVRRMIDELAAVDTRKHEVIIKFQLFKDAPPNIPLQLDVFDYAYNYAKEKGYQTTASVFDMDSLQFLLTYDIPFVKIANRPDLYWLAGEVPRKIPVYVSVGHWDSFDYHDGEYNWDCSLLACVSKYPATIEDYEIVFESYWFDAISDHTTDFTLYHKYKPDIYEVHYKLNDSTGPDAGLFARTPEQLGEVL